MKSRDEILEAAHKCVCGDREEDYGSPENNFRVIADLWNVYLGTDPDNGIDEIDVGMMLALLKIARIQSGRLKEDNFIDLAGYAACAGELAGRVIERTEKLKKELA